MADWLELGTGVFYRQTELYELPWGLALGDYRAVAARFGGPIALIRDETRLMQLGGSEARPVMHVFTAAGNPLAKFLWDKGRLVAFGWSSEESLVSISDDGTVQLHTPRGEPLPGFSLGRECREEGVADALVWGAGLVARTRSHCFVMVASLAEPRPQRLADAGLTAAPRCWAVLEPQHTASGSPELLVATATGRLLAVDAAAATDMALPPTLGAVCRLAASPHGRYLAAATDDGRLHVWAADLSQHLSDVATGVATPPTAVVWCGPDAVAVDFGAGGPLLLMGPYGDRLHVSLPGPEGEGPRVLVPEIDGLRITTGARAVFLDRVPAATIAALAPGSVAPAALLLDASAHFAAGHAAADESLRSMGRARPAAVEACLEAAAAAWAPGAQKALLAAARYGAAFSPRRHAGRLDAVCAVARVLTAVRHHEIGLPLSHPQYKALTPAVLAARLAATHRHLLAIRVCGWLGLPAAPVVLHWASCRVAAGGNLGDVALRDALVPQLRSCPGASFAAAAAAARNAGRPRLAALLLDLEPRAADTVPLLSALGEDDRAVGRAVDCGDTDLAHLALLAAARRRPQAELFRLAASRPATRALFAAYCRQADPPLLAAFLDHTGAHAASAEAVLRALYAELYGVTSTSGTGWAFTPADSGRWARALASASELYRLAAGGKEGKEAAAGGAGGVTAALPAAPMAPAVGFGLGLPFGGGAGAGGARVLAEMAAANKAAVDDASLLLKHQVELESGTTTLSGPPAAGGTFRGLSLSDTVRLCLARGQTRAADRLRREFAIPDTRWWTVKISALAAARDWDALDAFARDRRPPIGHGPFVAAAAQHGAPGHVMSSLIARLPDPRARAEAYAAAGLKQEAAEAEAQAREGDGDLLSRLRNAVGGAGEYFSQGPAQP